MKSYYLIILISFFAIGCDLEPDLDQAIDNEAFLKDKDFLAASLDEAYNQLPAFYSYEFGDFLDCATDNAVTNDFNSPVKLMATGGWTASQNPLDNWQLAYSQIRNINHFIEVSPDIAFSNDPEKDAILSERLKGEAFFLRAYYQFLLLTRFSGIDDNGQLMGFPIVVEPLSDADLASASRNTFDECVNQIMSDIDSAILSLPEGRYEGSDVVLGANQVGRAYNQVALSLKSRLLLYAASPAYTVNKSESEKQQLWEDAAIAAMEVIAGVGNLPSIGSLGNLYTSPNSPEIIWRSYQPDTNVPEENNFMPSLWGNGRTNPSQQLVDAFPMEDGYPIHLSPSYDPSDPYSNRDSRFDYTVVYNDADFGDTNAEIFAGGKDFESTVNNRATRTGYYLRKFIDPNVVITPGEPQSTSPHYYAFFRYAEIWLNFAEAANEAWGPTADPQMLGKTAQSALGELRERAGILAPDPYLEEIAAAGKNDFRQLVHNERRIELSFENHRFYDVRRWLLPLSFLNEDIEGVRVIKNGEMDFSFQFGLEVEQREFREYMYYGPLPEQVVYASENISQNAGW